MRLFVFLLAISTAVLNGQIVVTDCRGNSRDSPWTYTYIELPTGASVGNSRPCFNVDTPAKTWTATLTGDSPEEQLSLRVDMGSVGIVGTPGNSCAAYNTCTGDDGEEFAIDIRGFKNASEGTYSNRVLTFTASAETDVVINFTEDVVAAPVAVNWIWRSDADKDGTTTTFPFDDCDLNSEGDKPVSEDVIFGTSWQDTCTGYTFDVIRADARRHYYGSVPALNSDDTHWIDNDNNVIRVSDATLVYNPSPNPRAPIWSTLDPDIYYHRTDGSSVISRRNWSTDTGSSVVDLSSECSFTGDPKAGHSSGPAASDWMAYYDDDPTGKFALVDLVNEVAYCYNDYDATNEAGQTTVDFISVTPGFDSTTGLQYVVLFGVQGGGSSYYQFNGSTLSFSHNAVEVGWKTPSVEAATCPPDCSVLPHPSLVQLEDGRQYVALRRQIGPQGIHDFMALAWIGAGSMMLQFETLGDGGGLYVGPQIGEQAQSFHSGSAVNAPLSIYSFDDGTVTAKVVTDATNASPIVVTSAGHGYSDAVTVHVGAVGGNPAANGEWVTANVAMDTFELVGSTGDGTYTSGGLVSAQTANRTFHYGIVMLGGNPSNNEIDAYYLGHHWSSQTDPGGDYWETTFCSPSISGDLMLCASNFEQPGRQSTAMHTFLLSLPSTISGMSMSGSFSLSGTVSVR